MGESADHRADDEDRDRNDEQALAADQVTELAVDRQRDGGRQNVGGGHPEHVVDAVELPDDGGQRRAEDHLVERRQQHRDHQAGEDQQDVTLLGHRCCALSCRLVLCCVGTGAGLDGVIRSCQLLDCFSNERYRPLFQFVQGKVGARRRPLFRGRPTAPAQVISRVSATPSETGRSPLTSPFRAMRVLAAAVSCSVIRAIRASIRSSSCGCCRMTSSRDSVQGGLVDRRAENSNDQPDDGLHQVRAVVAGQMSQSGSRG